MVAFYRVKIPLLGYNEANPMEIFLLMVTHSKYSIASRYKQLFCKLVVHLFLRLHVQTTPWMKCSCKTDKPFQKEGSIFLVTDHRPIKILQTTDISSRIESQALAPVIEQGPPGYYIQFCKTGENLYILAIAYIEIFIGIDESPCLTFVMLFNKLLTTNKVHF